MKVGRNESSRSSSTRSGGIRRRRGDQWRRNCDCFQRHDLGDPCAGQLPGNRDEGEHQDPVAGPLRSIRPMLKESSAAFSVPSSWPAHHGVITTSPDPSVRHAVGGVGLRAPPTRALPQRPPPGAPNDRPHPPCFVHGLRPAPAHAGSRSQAARA